MDRKKDEWFGSQMQVVTRETMTKKTMAMKSKANIWTIHRHLRNLNLSPNPSPSQNPSLNLNPGRTRKRQLESLQVAKASVEIRSYSFLTRFCIFYLCHIIGKRDLILMAMEMKMKMMGMLWTSTIFPQSARSHQDCIADVHSLEGVDEVCTLRVQYNAPFLHPRGPGYVCMYNNEI